MEEYKLSDEELHRIREKYNMDAEKTEVYNISKEETKALKEKFSGTQDTGSGQCVCWDCQCSYNYDKFTKACYNCGSAYYTKGSSNAVYEYVGFNTSRICTNPKKNANVAESIKLIENRKKEQEKAGSNKNGLMTSVELTLFHLLKK